MKRITLIMAAITILFVALWSCNKDTELVKTTEQSTIFSRILDFKNQVESNEKSSILTPVDSAVFYIEAALNYKHALIEGDEPYTNTSFVDTITIACSNTDSLINYSNLVSTYLYLNTNIETNYLKFLGDNKNIGLINIEYDGKNFICYTHIDYEIYTGKSENFDRDWRYGNKYGDCFGNFINERDAATELDAYLHTFHPNVSAGFGKFWTNLYTSNAKNDVGATGP